MTTTRLSTPTVTLTYDEAVDLLNRAVAEKGVDYVYTETSEYDELDGCSYFYRGAPSCIVGHVLAYRGVDADQMLVGVVDLNNSNVDGLVGRNVLGADAKTQRLLDVAQDQQDGGTPWGDAVAVAIWAAENDRNGYEYRYAGPEVR